jgi:uncharacterized protein
MSRQQTLARFIFRLYEAARGPHLPSCRFVPSCSRYALESVEVHGSRRGIYLSLRRFARCHPWGGWGVDPVPPPSGAVTAGTSPGTR